MYNELCFNKGINRWILVIAGLFAHYVTIAQTETIPDSVFYKLAHNPEMISAYSTQELTNGINQKRIIQWCNVIGALRETGISRNILQQYYFPVCRSVIIAYCKESEMMRELALGRIVSEDRLIQEDSSCSGRGIGIRFKEYQRALIALKRLPFDKIITPFMYGELRMLESFIWGDNKYMDKVDPIPDKLIADLNSIFGVRISELEQDLPGLVQAHSQDSDFLISNSALLCNAATYISGYNMGLVCGIISNAYITNNKASDFMELINIQFHKRWGANIWNKIKPIVTFQMTGVLEFEAINTFLSFRDSLATQHKELAKYYPHQCPDELKCDKLYEEYNNKYYAAIDYVFSLEVINTQQILEAKQLYNILGCSSQQDFVRTYANETFRRYYDTEDFSLWGRIENLRRYFENAVEYPVDIALDIIECYAPINAPQARELIRKISLDSWVDKQMKLSPQDVNELGLRAASVIAYVYASLHNENRYPDIYRLIDWIDENISKSDSLHEAIIFNISSALTLMGEHRQSCDWISKIRIDKSEYKHELYKLLLENYRVTGDTKRALHVASKMNSFSYLDLLQWFVAKLEEGDVGEMDKLLNTFTSCISQDFNQFVFMGSENQDWASRVARYRISEIFMDMDIASWILESKNKDDRFLGIVQQYIAAIRYNWALASKGSLLRSYKYIMEMVLNKMSSEDYQYYRRALNFDKDNYPEDNAESRIDAYVSQQVKEILLSYVRLNTSNDFPQFDYNVVRQQLQSGDIAVEIVRAYNDVFNIILVRRNWEFPKLETISWKENDNNTERLWSEIGPYLTDVKRIYISLDGEFYFENIEHSTDSTGIYMADKYDIYRVSTTLTIPNDVYVSDIQQSVLYGNLKYSNSDNYSYNIPFPDITRGAANVMWEPLEDTKEELIAISGLLSVAHVPCAIYQGIEGNKASFMSLDRQDVNLLHLSTHGFYSKKDLFEPTEIPAMKRCGIVLSNSEYDLSYKESSGSIFANEIANMDLGSIKLLVLSACETACGDLDDDGVFGLQRGFKQAGVGCIIMSLNKVNSVMTTELMKAFYDNFLEGQSARQAFRNAQKQISVKYDIEDWKSFIIID